MAKVLKVEKAKAVSLFMALGFKTAGKWDAKKLQEKINIIEEAPAEPLEDKVLDELLDEILGSDVVKIIDDEDEDEDDEPKKDEPKKEKKVAKKAAKVEKKAKKENRLTRIQSTIDVLKKLKKSGLTMEEVFDASDEAIVRSGGDSNKKEAAYSARLAIQAIERWGEIAVSDGKVRPVIAE